MKKAYLGIDIGSISTKGVIIDSNNSVLAKCYLWTKGNPKQAVKEVLENLKQQLPKEYKIVGLGTTGSARKLMGTILGANIIKNEITAHAVGTLSKHKDIRTIIEIGGQDCKIILLKDGIVIDYAMNTVCAAGTGAFDHADEGQTGDGGHFPAGQGHRRGSGAGQPGPGVFQQCLAAHHGRGQ